MNAPSRWTDDRLDDLHQLVSVNDKRIDRNDRLVDAHDNQLRQISRTGDRRAERHWALWLMLATLLAGQIADIIVHAAHAG